MDDIDPQDIEVLHRVRRISEVLVIETRCGDILLEMTLALPEARKLLSELTRLCEES
jgi:hypothetical protein